MAAWKWLKEAEREKNKLVFDPSRVLHPQIIIFFFKSSPVSDDVL